MFDISIVCYVLAHAKLYYLKIHKERGMILISKNL